MSHPPPYTFRMKNKIKVSLCSESDTFVVSLTPRFSEVPPQRNRSQLFQQFLALTQRAPQLVPLPFEISNLKFAILHFFAIHFFACSPPRPMRSFAAIFPILTVNNGN